MAEVRAVRLQVGIALVLMVSVAAIGCDQTQGRWDRPSTDRRFASNGERIYFTSTSASGSPITYEGGSHGGRMMHRLACIDCHGPEGQGGRVTIMMQSFEAPSVTWSHLTEEAHGEDGHGDEEMAHPPYTEETVRRAITEGVDPAGNRLDTLMSRWSMSEQSLDDLVDYLKTLE